MGDKGHALETKFRIAPKSGMTMMPGLAAGTLIRPAPADVSGSCDS